MTRLHVSLSITNAAPASTHAGTRMTWRFPTISRMMCGTMRPTNPSNPMALTVLAARRPPRQ